MVELVLYTPSHPDQFSVEFSAGEYASSLKSLKAFIAGEVMTNVNNVTKRSRAYTSVQYGIGADDNFEFNSDLVYINHSCDPNVAIDISSSDESEWHVRALKDIHPGDYLTFFYPSTEWDMVQPFQCRCEQPSCLGMIQGAKYIPEVVILTKGFINPWILQMIRERDAKVAESLLTEETCHEVPHIRHMVQV